MTEPPRRPKNIPRNLKPYYLCFLIKGERWNEPEEGLAPGEDLMAAQLAFLREQIEWKRYKLAGPVTSSAQDAAASDIVGFSILEAESPQAAFALASQDPAVVAGRVTLRLLPAVLPALDSLKVEY